MMRNLAFALFDIVCLVVSFWATSPENCRNRLYWGVNAVFMQDSNVVDVPSFALDLLEEQCQRHSRAYWVWFISGLAGFAAGHIAAGLYVELLFLLKKGVKSAVWPMEYVDRMPRYMAASEMLVILKAVILGLPPCLSVYTAAALYLELPVHFNLLRFLLYFTVFPAITELWVFCYHGFLHTRFMYKHVHSVHHRFPHITVWSTNYLHPVEFATGILSHQVIMMFLVRADIYTSCFFVFLASLGNTFDHSGFDITHHAALHCVHHVRPTKNLGANGFLDRIYGTYMDPRIEPIDDKAD